MREITLVLILLIIIPFSYSQVSFEKNFGKSQFDFGYSVEETFDGGYIISGTTDNNLMLTKVNINGDTIWCKTYSREFGEKGYDIHQPSDSGYTLLSHSVWHDWGDAENIFLIKTDTYGDTIWTKSYGSEVAESFQPTIDNGYIIVGSTYNFENEVKNILLIKTSEWYLFCENH